MKLLQYEIRNKKNEVIYSTVNKSDVITKYRELSKNKKKHSLRIETWELLVTWYPGNKL